MRKLNDAPELEEFEKRVQSDYGRQKIALEDHNRILNLLDSLRVECKAALERGRANLRKGAE